MGDGLMVVLVGEVVEAQRELGGGRVCRKGYEKEGRGLTWPWNRPMNMWRRRGQEMSTNVAISVGGAQGILWASVNADTHLGPLQEQA